MSTKLAEIVAATRRRLINSRRTADFRELELLAKKHTPRGFRRALESKAANGTAIIAELKKASPSRGLIRADFNVSNLASGIFGVPAGLLITFALSLIGNGPSPERQASLGALRTPANAQEPGRTA